MSLSQLLSSERLFIIFCLQLHVYLGKTAPTWPIRPTWDVYIKWRNLVFECLGLNVISRNKQRNFVFVWNISIRRRPTIGGYSQFIPTFMAIAYRIIHGASAPRIFPQQKELLQLSKDVVVEDWYLYEDYMELWDYRCELHPYCLPVFVPMRIFALEFIWHLLNVELLHFIPAKKVIFLKWDNLWVLLWWTQDKIFK